MEKTSGKKTSVDAKKGKTGKVKDSVSEIDCTMKGGETTIHLRNTCTKHNPDTSSSTEEVDGPKRPQMLQHGRGPMWVLREEVIRRKIEIQQKIYLEEMKKRQKKKRLLNKRQKKTQQEYITSKIGPGWYQELCPEQINVLNNLSKCISKDFLSGGINNVKENMRNLGLVLQPNSILVTISLACCNGDPVVFIWNLYKLRKSNNKSNNYSLNDRILLSSIVHLTMCETLRELHIRIPSPPRLKKKENNNKNVVKVARKRYNSPYLEPFTFEPNKWWEGQRLNRRIQYPESPYFSYIQELLLCMKETNDPFVNQQYVDYNQYKFNVELKFMETEIPMSPVEKEILEELRAAQTIYNNLKGSSTSRKLLCPSLHRSYRENKYQNTPLENSPKVIECLYDFNDTAESPESRNGINERKTYTNQYDLDTSEEGLCVESEETSQSYNSECDCNSKPSTEESSIFSENTGSSSTLCADVEIESEGAQERKFQSLYCQCKEMTEIKIRNVENKKSLSTSNLKPTYIISGTKMLESSQTVPIIEGIKGAKKCKCLESYTQHVQKWEREQRVKSVQNSLKESGKNFVIGGVSVDREGNPVYILSGVSTERTCRICKAAVEKQRIENERLAKIPKTLLGRQKYQIAGVRSTPTGNTYIISGVVPIDDCDCMKLYKGFVQKHSPCMELYERYMKRTKKEMKYFSEPDEVKSTTSDICRDLDTENLLPSEDSPVSSCAGSSESSTCMCSESKETIEDSESCQTQQTTSDSVEEQCSCCSCTDDCFCEGEGEQSKEDDVTRDTSTQLKTELRRFILLDKFPAKEAQRIGVVKRALQMMAEDGYPLAQLPDVHKLPHFKLWMEWRSRKYWTVKNKEKYWAQSKRIWRYIDVCRDRLVVPNLKMSHSEAATYTYANSKFVKELTNKIKEDHFRRTKQNIIGKGREFFPSMFLYEFPGSSFRDCFFSYIPSHENMVFSNNPWKRFDYKPFTLIRNRLRGRQSC